MSSSDSFSSRNETLEVDTDRKVQDSSMETASSSFWTLQIKPVGDEADFFITLHPDDDILQLYQQVASRTGVPQEQQRLIYRGRLIPNHRGEEDASHKENGASMHASPQQKIKDIVGLTNGHSIHLVRRAQKEESTSDQENAAPGELDSASNTTPSATSTLLSALLGAGTSRRAAHRLREEDWIRPDPGSMETVRQGLLTLHTLEHSSERRQFYRGQWIDCRDTVNMWLEATVVDILNPLEIIHNAPDTSSSERSSRNPVVPTSDPAIAVTDLEGRRRLLLEPCTDPAEAIECMDGTYYRYRSNNDAVQILHVHYNGWPVRWDEWIRSDSERIRPFRVRTLHDASSASPNIEATMPHAPTTYMTGPDEPSDRPALLPELQRVMSAVSARLDAVVAPTSPSATPRRAYLPWMTTMPGESLDRAAQRQALEELAPFLDRLGRTLVDAAPHVLALADALGEEDAHPEDEEDDEEEEGPSPRPPSTLGGLLSLLSVRDRGNRHGSVASSNGAVPSVVSDVEVSLASSTTGDAAIHADEDEEEEEEIEEEEEVTATQVDPDLRDFAVGMVNTTRGDVRNRSHRSSDDATASLLGAYLAAMSLSDGSSGVTEGLGRLLRGNGTGGIDIHIHAVVTAPGLEGAIGLAALTGGTAFPVATPVTTTTNATSPMAAAASGGLSGLFGGSPRESNRRGGAVRQGRATTLDSTFVLPSNLDEDSDLFAELYSETPEPINPNRSTSASSSTSPNPTSTPSVRTEDLSYGSTSGVPNRRSRSRSRSMRRMLPQNLHGSFNHGGENSSNAETPQGSDASLGSGPRNANNSGLLRRFFRRSDGGA